MKNLREISQQANRTKFKTFQNGFDLQKAHDLLQSLEQISIGRAERGEFSATIYNIEVPYIFWINEKLWGDQNAFAIDWKQNDHGTFDLTIGWF